jgi:hypothetical protein
MTDIVSLIKSKGYTCIAHHTTIDNLKNIIKSKYIYTDYERYLNKINSRGVYSYQTFDFNKPYEVSDDQFPGIYMHLAHDINKISISKNQVLIIFPLELLLQKNWHFNLSDKNGIIGYDTYFHNNITNMPSRSEILKHYDDIDINYIGNELIFHDAIPLNNSIEFKYSAKCIKRIEYSDTVEYNLTLDLDRKPCKIYYSDAFYNGIEVPYFNKNIIEFKYNHYKNWIKRHIPTKYHLICDNSTTKKMLDTNLHDITINNMNVFTYYFIYRTFKCL